MEDLEKMRIQNIEFLRFLFAVIIILFHGGHASPDGYLAVEMFFVLAGYFLACSANKIKQQTLGGFMFAKWARLWPLFAFAVILAGGNLYDMVFKLLFLHATGLTLKYQGFIWFVAPFFWTMVLYFIVLKHYGKPKAFVPVALLTYSGYVLIINYDNGNFNIRQTVDAVFSLAMLRAVAGIGLGILLVPLFDKAKQILPDTSSLKSKLLIGSVEGGILFFFIYNMLFHHLKYDNKLIFVVLLGIELFLFIERRGFVSQVLDNKYFGFMGRYAYAMYIMQAIGLKTAAKINKTLAFDSVYDAITELLLVIVFGVLGYHLIERPISAKLLPQKSRRR